MGSNDSFVNDSWRGIPREVLNDLRDLQNEAALVDKKKFERITEAVNRLNGLGEKGWEEFNRQFSGRSRSSREIL